MPTQAQPHPNNVEASYPCGKTRKHPKFFQSIYRLSHNHATYWQPVFTRISNNQSKLVMTRFQSLFSALATALILCAASLSPLHAQMIMEIDPGLKAATEAHQVKQKGMKAVPYLSFDEYQIVSSKAGWYTTNTRNNFQGELSASSQQISFAMTNGAGDTAIVNMTKNGLVQSQANALFPSITMSQGSQNVTIQVNSSADTLTWGVAISVANGVFNGAIKTDTEEYKLLPVNRMDNGRTAPFTLWVGFGIYRNEKEIGAVQATPKRNVWMLPNLPEDQKLKLAATCLALIVMEQKEWLLR